MHHNIFSATEWNASGINGVNLKHADCNGDGVINEADIAAIDQNYHEDPAFDEPSMTSDPNISLGLNFDIDTIILGNGSGDSGVLVIEADINVDIANALVPLYGLAFQVDFNNGSFTLADAFVEFDSDSWLTDNNVAISYDRFISDLNRLDVSVSRTDQIPVTGSGRIGRMTLIIEDIIIGRLQEETITIEAVMKMSWQSELLLRPSLLMERPMMWLYLEMKQ